MNKPRAQRIPPARRRAGRFRRGKGAGPESGRSEITRHLSSAALVVPRGTPWHALTRGQQAALLTRACVQLGLLAAALRDLRHRSPDQIRGPKTLWVLVAGVNYLGVGPLAYFVLGRRRRPSRAAG